MTKDELITNIDNAITTKTEINSITPLIHGTVLKAVVEYLYNGIIAMGVSAEDLTGIFQAAPTNKILPDLQEGEARIYFVSESGDYKTADSSQQITVAESEKALIKFDGENWEKVSIDNLAQDIASNSKDKAVSQYLIKKLFNEINEKIDNIVIPDSVEQVLNTAGNTQSSERLYLTGTQEISEEAGGNAQTFVHSDVYMQNGVIYGEVNNYRYMKCGIWNTLGGNIIKDLYDEKLLNAEITSKADTSSLINGGMSGKAYLRLGRIFAEKENRGYNTTILLHVHSQRNQSDGHFGNGFTCFVNKANGSDKVNITTLFLNNGASVSKAGIVFNQILTKEVTDFDGQDGVDIILEYTKGEGNNAICASALLLSDAADLYQGEEYQGCFDFTYNINLQKEYIQEHNNCTIPTNREDLPYNKSALYISKTKPEGCTEHSIESNISGNDDYVIKDTANDTELSSLQDSYNYKKVFFRLYDENDDTVQKTSIEAFSSILVEKFKSLGLLHREKTFKKLKIAHPSNLGFVADGSSFEFDTSSIYWNGVRLFPDISYSLTQDNMIEFDVTDDSGENIYPTNNDILMIEAYFE
ncbi:MAG: hypothetical protein IJ759_07560 [Bacteroidales bacterium]|nr:hypothetical protein [Bacteroidales bacterium]